ncbi:MAG: hypothetical protein UE699_06765 [Bacilli bacterium]|nr:hypothetical protein [Mycoplasmatota bacterium]MDD6941273.1 hypothetical protein [bacterium]MDY2697687.1 hypothetical protein [Bacilli bacterium]MEE0015362.1 hypothetical protein [Bacilli bacterium]
MKNNGVEVEAQKIYKRKLFIKIVKIAFLLLLILISIIYLFLYIIYAGGRFTVSLDKNMSNRKNVFLSEDGNVKNKARKLSADTIEYMDNISIKWLPDNIDTEKNGGHNGDNYIAYTFYVINSGKEKVNYWYEIDIDDTIKNVDEAIRIMIYRNGERTVYAKKSKDTGQAEPGTKKFISSKIAVLEQRKNFKPSSKDRYTVVVWIEGDDPECKNDLLGGEIKLHMDFTEEHVDK